MGHEGHRVTGWVRRQLPVRVYTKRIDGTISLMGVSKVEFKSGFFYEGIEGHDD